MLVLLIGQAVHTLCLLQNASGHGAFPVMEPPGSASDRQIQPQQYLDLLTVTFDKVKNSIGLSIIEAVVSIVAQHASYSAFALIVTL